MDNTRGHLDHIYFAWDTEYFLKWANILKLGVSPLSLYSIFSWGTEEYQNWPANLPNSNSELEVSHDFSFQKGTHTHVNGHTTTCLSQKMDSRFHWFTIPIPLILLVVDRNFFGHILPVKEENKKYKARILCVIRESYPNK